MARVSNDEEALDNRLMLLECKDDPALTFVDDYEDDDELYMTGGDVKDDKRRARQSTSCCQ